MSNHDMHLKAQEACAESVERTPQIQRQDGLIIES